MLQRLLLQHKKYLQRSSTDHGRISPYGRRSIHDTLEVVGTAWQIPTYTDGQRHIYGLEVHCSHGRFEAVQSSVTDGSMAMIVSASMIKAVAIW